MLKINTKNPKGFTLLEIVIALGISCAALAGLASVFLNQQQARASQKQTLAMHQNLRSAIFLMAQEIRKAGYDPLDKYKGTAGITKIVQGDSSANNSGQLEFTYYDKKNDRLHQSVIRLFDSSNDPENTKDEIQIKKGGQSIAENIDFMNFVFWDQNGQETSDMSAIRSVTIFLKARCDEHLSSKAASQNLSMTVNCKNLGS